MQQTNTKINPEFTSYPKTTNQKDIEPGHEYIVVHNFQTQKKKSKWKPNCDIDIDGDEFRQSRNNDSIETKGKRNYCQIGRGEYKQQKLTGFNCLQSDHINDYYLTLTEPLQHFITPITTKSQLVPLLSPINSQPQQSSIFYLSEQNQSVYKLESKSKHSLSFIKLIKDDNNNSEFRQNNNRKDSDLSNGDYIESVRLEKCNQWSQITFGNWQGYKMINKQSVKDIGVGSNDDDGLIGRGECDGGDGQGNDRERFIGMNNLQEGYVVVMDSIGQKYKFIANDGSDNYSNGEDQQRRKTNYHISHKNTTNNSQLYHINNTNTNPLLTLTYSNYKQLINKPITYQLINIHQQNKLGFLSSYRDTYNRESFLRREGIRQWLMSMSQVRELRLVVNGLVERVLDGWIMINQYEQQLQRAIIKLQEQLQRKIYEIDKQQQINEQDQIVCGQIKQYQVDKQLPLQNILQRKQHSQLQLLLQQQKQQNNNVQTKKKQQQHQQQSIEQQIQQLQQLLTMTDVQLQQLYNEFSQQQQQITLQDQQNTELQTQNQTLFQTITQTQLQYSYLQTNYNKQLMKTQSIIENIGYYIQAIKSINQHIRQKLINSKYLPILMQNMFQLVYLRLQLVSRTVKVQESLKKWRQFNLGNGCCIEGINRDKDGDISVDIGCNYNDNNNDSNSNININNGFNLAGGYLLEQLSKQLIIFGTQYNNKLTSQTIYQLLQYKKGSSRMSFQQISNSQLYKMIKTFYLNCSGKSNKSNMINTEEKKQMQKQELFKQQNFFNVLFNNQQQFSSVLLKQKRQLQVKKQQQNNHLYQYQDIQDKLQQAKSNQQLIKIVKQLINQFQQYIYKKLHCVRNQYVGVNNQKLKLQKPQIKHQKQYQYQQLQSILLTCTSIFFVAKLKQFYSTKIQMTNSNNCSTSINKNNNNPQSIHKSISSLTQIDHDQTNSMTIVVFRQLLKIIDMNSYHSQLISQQLFNYTQQFMTFFNGFFYSIIQKIKQNYGWSVVNKLQQSKHKQNKLFSIKI